MRVSSATGSPWLHAWRRPVISPPSSGISWSIGGSGPRRQPGVDRRDGPLVGVAERARALELRARGLRQAPRPRAIGVRLPERAGERKPAAAQGCGIAAGALSQCDGTLEAADR